MSSDLVPTSVWSFPLMRFSSLMDDDSWLRQSANPGGLSVTEDETTVYVDAALPGVRSDDIDISFHNGVLRISGEVNAEDKKERKSYRMMNSSYTYQIAVPGEIDPNAEPEATCSDGVVTVSFSKLSAAQPKKISIKNKASGGRSKKSEEKTEAKSESKAEEKVSVKDEIPVETATAENVSGDEVAESTAVPEEEKE